MSESHRLPHIQGLRGVSVLLILLFHAGFIFRGGFVGVDIFFVISGFVITRMLMREKVSNQGKIYWNRFFFNRARRLIPSLSIVTTLTLIMVFVLFDKAERFAAANEVFSVMFFWSNAFFFLKNDYLALNADVFTHMWSLAVEEQFYLVLPAVFVVIRLAKRIFKIKEKTAFLNVFWSLIFLSLLSNILLTNFSESLGIPVHLIPERFAFFATPTRIWEILIGAVGSLINYPTEPKSKSVKIITNSSLVGIACSAVFLDSWMKFPGINAIPVVLSTLFLVVYGNQVSFVSKILNLRPLIWMGEMSYNLYLVHWPILVILKHQFGGNSTIRFFAMLISFPIAKGLHGRVDQPFRRLSVSRRKTALTCLAVMIVAPVLLSAIYLMGAPSVDLKVTDSANSLPYYSLGSNMCVDVAISDFERTNCISGSIKYKKKLLLIGDSHAASISEAVISAYLKINPKGSVFVWSKSGCPFLNDDNINRTCDINRDFIIDLIKTEKPTEIVISNAITRYLYIENLNDLPPGLGGKLKEVGLSYQRTFVYLDQLQIPIYIVHEIPKLDPTLLQKSVNLSKVQSKLIEILESSTLNLSNVRFIDLSKVICPNSLCSRLVNEESIYLDGDSEHLTGSGSMALSSKIEASFSYGK
jgi:peptidoglycan/LPS O-acetylase OafA/YrhL